MPAPRSLSARPVPKNALYRVLLTVIAGAAAFSSASDTTVSAPRVPASACGGNSFFSGCGSSQSWLSLASTMRSSLHIRDIARYMFPRMSCAGFPTVSAPSSSTKSWM